MNMQEAFDRAAVGVIKQGVPSVAPDGSCQYITGEAKCGVGHLLANDAMCASWDEAVWTTHDLVKDESIRIQMLPDMKLSGIDQLPIEFLNDLQLAHDLASPCADFIAEFKSAMREVADKWELDKGMVQ